MKNLRELQLLINEFVLRASDLNNKFSEAKELLNEIAGQQPEPQANLSPQERKVVLLIAQQKSTIQIAKSLNVSKRTIDVTRFNIRKKLNLERKDSLEEFAKKWVARNFGS